VSIRIQTGRPYRASGSNLEPSHFTSPDC